MHIDMSQEESKSVAGFFQITEDDAPTARILTMGQEQKTFVPEFSELTADNIRTWVQDFLDGKLKVGKGLRSLQPIRDPHTYCQSIVVGSHWPTRVTGVWHPY